MPKHCNDFYGAATSPLSDINELQEELENIIEEGAYPEASKEQKKAVQDALDALTNVENKLSMMPTGIED